MKKKGFSIIVACDERMGIGRGGALPWHIPSDLKRFKEVTTASYGVGKNVLIMGRKTWESIPDRFRPLPSRINVVITSQDDYILPAGVIKAGSLEEALRVYCDEARDDVGAVFVIGGAQVYAEAIKNILCERIYLTRIHEVADCDVFFPKIPSQFLRTDCSSKKEENKKMFSFNIFSIRRP